MRRRGKYGPDPARLTALARGAGLGLAIDADAAPLLAQAEALAKDGFVTGASHRKWTAFGEAVDLRDGFPEWRRHLLTDPPASGGPLVACEAKEADTIPGVIREEGLGGTAIVGHAEAGSASIRITR